MKTVKKQIEAVGIARRLVGVSDAERGVWEKLLATIERHVFGYVWAQVRDQVRAGTQDTKEQVYWQVWEQSRRYLETV